jgi:hypothetical protein
MTAPVGEVMTPITAGKYGKQLLSRLVEQALGGQSALAFLEQRHQRAETGRLQRLHHDLVLRAVRISGEPSGDHHFETRFEFEFDARGRAAPDDAGDAGALILEIEVNVAVRVITDFTEFAAHAHVAIRILDGALKRRRELGDGQFRQIEAWFVHRGNIAAGR